MAEENQSADGAADDTTSLMGNNPPEDKGNEDNSNNDTTPEQVAKVDEEGNPVLDDDGNPVMVDQEPEGYTDFTFDEGVEIDAELLESASGTFAELGLSQEQAQGVVEVYAKIQAEGAENLSSMINGWQEESKSNSEYGGEAFNANIALAKSGLEKVGFEGFDALLEETGLGNHPAVIGTLINVGKLFAEDSPNQGSANAQQKSREEILYPNS